MEKTYTFKEIFAEMKRMALSDETMRTAVKEYEEADALSKSLMEAQITYLMNQPLFKIMSLSSALETVFTVDPSIYRTFVNYLNSK